MSMNMMNMKRMNGDDVGLEKCLLELDEPPSDELVERIITSVGERAKEGMKVEVPYMKLLEMAGLNEDSWWKGDSTYKLQVPLGRRGARRVQYLTLGEGTAHHALVVGKTGSGKSNLMHIMITTSALTYSPDELRLYLVDFKEGVEFEPYAEAQLPHAEAIAIETEREFGISILKRLNEEIERRGELFRNNGVNTIDEYKEKTREKMPRILLLVDEFQEFFTQDDFISRDAAHILDRLVRQGRAFGIHVLLGSQTLAGSYTLARSTIDQMAVRIALQCSEADSRLVLSDDNPAARLLSRPGEAIYNAANGLVEGNNPFQIALFTDKDRDKVLQWLKQRRAKDLPKPIVFEGHLPARLEECQPLNELLSAGEWPTRRRTVEAWLGEPVSIRPPVSASFKRQSGSHLLIVTRHEEEGVGMLTASLLSIIVQQRPESAQFYIVDLATADSPWANLARKIAELFPHQIKVLRRRDLVGLLDDLTNIINQRIGDEGIRGPELYLFIQGLHRARDLRQEEGGYDFSLGISEERGPSPPEQFATILREGPEVGVHVLVWCDTVANMKRVLDRKMLGEFNMRVAGAMSNDDSVSLLDEPVAARLDKPHRAIFYDEERPGYLEKFRPYAIPKSEWLEQIAEHLSKRSSK